MNNNTVELLVYYGSDAVIAQSAWTSTSRDLSPEKIERIPNLLVQLWSQGHETPFEKAKEYMNSLDLVPTLSNTTISKTGNII